MIGDGVFAVNIEGDCANWLVYSYGEFAADDFRNVSGRGTELGAVAIKDDDDGFGKIGTFLYRCCCCCCESKDDCNDCDCDVLLFPGDATEEGEFPDDAGVEYIEMFFSKLLIILVSLFCETLERREFLFLITSVLSDNGRIVPCNFWNKPHALQSVLPFGSRLHNGVFCVWQLKQTVFEFEGVAFFFDRDVDNEAAEEVLDNVENEEEFGILIDPED